MKCPYCQTEYQDGLGACPNCAAQSAQTSYEPSVQYPTAAQILKSIGNINLFLIATVIYTIQCALVFITSGSLQVFEIIFTVGLWLFYAESKKESPDPFAFSETPLKIMKVIESIKYVILWIAAVSLGIALLMLAFSFGIVSAFDPLLKTAMIFFIICVTVMLAMMIVSILMYKGILNYLKGAISSIQTGTRPQKITKFAPYCMIVFAAIKIVGSVASAFVIELIVGWLTDVLRALSGMAIPANMFIGTETAGLDEMISLNATVSITSILSSLLLPVTTILFALFMLKAKDIMDGSYYPTPEEYFYQRQAQYNQAAAAYYAQQAQYQPPQYQTPVAPQAEAQPTEAQAENNTENNE